MALCPSKLNDYFKYIHWDIGYKPMMILEGEVKPLDVVAKSILSLPLTNPGTADIDICLFVRGEIQESFNLFSEDFRILTCWDLVETLNLSEIAKPVQTSKSGRKIDYRVSSVELITEGNGYIRIDVHKVKVLRRSTTINLRQDDSSDLYQI